MVLYEIYNLLMPPTITTRFSPNSSTKIKKSSKLIIPFSSKSTLAS